MTIRRQGDQPRVAEAHPYAVAAGGDGDWYVVDAAADLPTIRANAPSIFAVTPGIRLPGGDTHDQARVSTPGDLIAAGANLLVIGRAVTAANDPASAAAEIAAHVQPSLAARTTQNCATTPAN